MDTWPFINIKGQVSSVVGHPVVDLISYYLIYLQASKGGSTATNFGKIAGDANGVRTILTVEKLGFT